MRTTLTCLIAAALAGLAGCEGKIASRGPEPFSPPEPEGPIAGPMEPTAGACDATKAAPDAPLKRLTAVQHANAVVDLLRYALPDAQLAASAATDLRLVLAAVPDDSRPEVGGDNRYSFRRMDQLIQQSWADATYDVADAAARLLTRSPYLAKLLPCATMAGDAKACVEGFIDRFGARALRAPLTAEQRAFYVSVYGDTSRFDAAALADVIGTMLAAPQFLYQVEHGADAVADRPTTYRLDAYELASRLSFQLWDTLPDAQLWAAASDGSLLDAEKYASEVDRLLHDPRARPVLDRFFGEWFLLEDIPELDALNAEPDFKAFAGSALPSSGLKAAMIDEVLELTRYYAWTKAGTLDDVLGTERVFARSAELAKLYGLAAPWDGASEPPSHAAGARPGVLTRAGLLAGAGVRTRPIIRGMRMRTRVLCEDIAPPPPNADDVANEKQAELPPTATARMEVEYLTETRMDCAACHKTQINPLGFALEGFDMLGRERTEEKVFSATGAVLATVPVDTRSVPKITPDDETAVSGAAELIGRVQASGKVQACFARQLVRFSLGRMDDVAGDACLTGAVRSTLDKGGSLTEALQSVALAPSFKERTFGPP